MRSTANAVWNGTLTEGSGEASLTSGAGGPFRTSWRARTEESGGGLTSPEELIAAAHASCYGMALSHILGGRGATPKRLETSATVEFAALPEGGFGITSSHITVRGEADGIDAEGFREAAEEARAGCPVSQALSDKVAITLEIQP